MLCLRALDGLGALECALVPEETGGTSLSCSRHNVQGTIRTGTLAISKKSWGAWGVATQSTIMCAMAH
eukprot:15436290-Alexandrium_andersonii.AAC.1